MKFTHKLQCLFIKPHLHGRLLAARIDILPFFFLKSRRSLTWRKIHLRFCLRDIVRHAPQKIKSQQSLTRERFYRDARIRLQLAEVTYTLRLRASDSRSSSLTRCEIVSKRGLLVLNLQMPIAAKALQMRSLSAFAFEANKLRNFANKIVRSQRKRKTKYKEYNSAANFIKTCNENVR